MKKDVVEQTFVELGTTRHIGVPMDEFQAVCLEFISGKIGPEEAGTSRNFNLQFPANEQGQPTGMVVFSVTDNKLPRAPEEEAK